jgi:hypothetical protein
MPKDTKYYWDYMHYTDAGVEVISKLVATALRPYIARKFSVYLKADCRELATDR